MNNEIRFLFLPNNREIVCNLNPTHRAATQLIECIFYAARSE